MDSTFEIRSQNQKTAGTGFVLFHAFDPQHPKGLQHVLCTANHVFTECLKDGNSVNLLLRRINAADPLKLGLELWPIKIAEAGRPKWVKHPTADIAVLPIELPEGTIKTVLPTSLLADSQTLREFYLGRDVFILGFPFGSLGLSGFPIFRAAKVAQRSLGDKDVFALTVAVFPGDSGGPVYWIERSEHGASVVILGVVTSAMSVPVPSTPPNHDGVAVRSTIVGLCRAGYSAIGNSSATFQQEGPWKDRRMVQLRRFPIRGRPRQSPHS
jgi:hypothetical protein